MKLKYYFEFNKTKSKKISTIYHGFNLNYFKNSRNLKLVKRKYKIGENQFVIGVSHD